MFGASSELASVLEFGFNTQGAYQSKSIPGSFFCSRQLEPDKADDKGRKQNLYIQDDGHVAVFLKQEVSSGQRRVL